MLSVSDETVRRHVQPLVKKGLVLRVHGGIVLPDQLQEAPYLRRMDENKQGKQRIAEKVADLIENGEALFLDSGSTTAYVALALTRHRKLSVVTNSVEIARTLASRNGNRVYMAGGELRGDDVASFGKPVVDFINQFHFNHAILSVGGVSEQNEIFDFHLEEMEVSQAAIARADQVMVVADYSKFTRRALIKVCSFAAVDTLVCDQTPPDALVNAAAVMEMTVVVT
jgi:DeoR family glycerol-3-phosphate regulon repressor